MSIFSNNLFQPQVFAALSQFSNLLSSARAGTSVNTGTYRRISSHRTSKAKHEKRQKSSEHSEEIRTANEIRNIDIADIIALPTEINVEELSPILLLARHGSKQTHVSAQTFFENKTGFPETSLSDPDIYQQVQTIMRSEPFRKLFSTYTSNLYFQQRRGFKTKKASDVDDSVNSVKSLYSWISPSPNTGLTNSVKENTKKEQTQSGKSDNGKDYYKGFHDGSIRGRGKKSLMDKIQFVLQIIYTVAFVLLIYSFFKVSGSFSMVNPNHTMFEVDPANVHVTFNDVKGIDTAKDELADVVDFLKDPEKYTSLGAKLPKGVLLIGPPGVGKTLLARAVAGEAGVPFFQCSGSEFDEMYVGLGAKRVRELFSHAKQKGPCVIFIDEIDSVAAKRTSSALHPYANQTINQLLAEMDGFAANDGVIVVGATNRVDNLDKALRRPGRFDVEVRVHQPDLKGRAEILDLYISKIKAAPDVDPKALAKGTIGFTGADLHNLVNQAALRAAMEGSETVKMEHFEFARDKALMGPENKNKIPDEKTNWNTAIHEAGHTIVAYFTKDATPLHKVTITPRGMSLGHTSFIPDKEQYQQTKVELLAEMDVGMGGRAAEEIIFGSENVSTGATSDMQQATNIALNMVKRFGMSDKVGVRYFQEGARDVGTSFMITNDTSQKIQEQIDEEIKRLLQESYERAKAILIKHPSEHKRLAKALMEHETLSKDEIKAIIEGKKIKN